MDTVEIRPDPESFRRVAAALSKEADGKEYRAELRADLREALEPGVGAVRSAVLGMDSAGLPHEGAGLRQAVAAGVKTSIRLSGKSPGARIKVGKRAVPRFPNAARRLNARKWRHPLFGSPDYWVDQTGAPGWFDDTLRRLRPALAAAVSKALDKRAQRITRRSQ